MSVDDPNDPERQEHPDQPAAPARATGIRKSAAAHIHPVDDPDAWRHAVLPDPESPAP